MVLGTFPKAFSKATTSQGTTSKVYFPKLQLPKGQVRPSLQRELARGRALQLGRARGPSAAAKNGQGTESCGQDGLGVPSAAASTNLVPLGKLLILEVAAWKKPLEKYLTSLKITSALSSKPGTKQSIVYYLAKVLLPHLNNPFFKSQSSL